jgi:Rps23 Pro-64 3,4-dihydroxylase Tpa1-like proline 4-hydroxylase
MEITKKTLPITLGDGINFEIEEAKSAGNELSAIYTQSQPFPHIVIDDFLPVDLIDSIYSNFPHDVTKNEKHYERGYKGQHKRQINPNKCDSYVKSVFGFFNSAPILQFLENLTSIKGLIPDPYFIGGGFHEIKTGGLLGVHSDFRINEQLHIERRLNMIIYLNKEWEEEYGGNLELWDKGMKFCVKKIAPIYNRCVIFNTDKDSNHGHPEPLNTPQEITRKSIALYYYTASQKVYDDMAIHRTHYKPRPKDKLLKTTYFLKRLIKKK